MVITLRQDVELLSIGLIYLLVYLKSLKEKKQTDKKSLFLLMYLFS